jgi:hypothetical protein
MALPNIYEKSVCDTLVQRIEKLNASTQALWGKMNVAQMLAHCNITYDLAKGKVSSKNGAFTKFMLKLFVKNLVVNEKPYPHNSRTAPIFIVDSEQNFEKEKQALIQHIYEVQKQGASHFEGKLSDSFGSLTATEWNNLFYKHVDHHLSQFGF